VAIVGGVAGGAACAARLRRLDEKAEIVMFERGPYVSFANCGLPYHIGGVIPEEASLIVANQDLFRCRFEVDVRLRSEVMKINKEEKTIVVKDLAKGEEYVHAYDKLVLSTGASPIVPPLPGLRDNPKVFTLRTIPDARKVRAFVKEHVPKKCVVVGAGFIGLEMAENLHHIGLHTTVLERLPHVMPPLDGDLANVLHTSMREKGVELVLGDGIAGVETTPESCHVLTDSGKRIETDLVIMCIGVTPDNKLAREAGLDIGIRGACKVDSSMRTSHPDIHAVGDATMQKEFILGGDAVVPLAGPAARQGRVAAEVICGRDSVFRGVQGTAVCGLFGYTVAMTGLNEHTLRNVLRYENLSVITLHNHNHVTYYPGASHIHMKVNFDNKTGLILGAQAVGAGEGVERRSDVIAAFIQKRCTVHDMAEAELCYSPMYGMAKDPVNIAGMIGQNVLAGECPLSDWDTVLANPESIIVDVRMPGEMEDEGGIEHPGLRRIPLCSIRRRFEELPKDRPIHVLCREGQRAYYALRILRAYGRDACLLSGGQLLNQLRQGKPLTTKSVHAMKHCMDAEVLAQMKKIRAGEAKL
jgi:NADPH-dependent 2,4-dienoyl-CoA reductase/sulfur reductase-like enzyme/rhodanese-related sulfurtransferase